ncbi:MAG TPA: autotransporter assembly complex family protein [Syntrophales bacterium]|nr:autotransporter assembly complex family protein [Syntrophales bacterium]
MLSRILFFLFVCLLAITTAAIAAAESVRVVVEGLSGKELANVEAALAVPPNLIQDGKVDRLWLERFESQAPGRVREALEAFGYYRPEITMNMDTPEQGVYRLVVRVNAGEPVRLTKVQVQVQGPGASETVLTKAVSDFPLHTGEVLRQDIYERAKGEIQSKAAGLGYLDAQFSVHAIRLNETESKAEIELVLETGRQYRFGEANFLGAPRYPREYLHTFLDFKPGDPFSSEKILQTQLNLATAERFQSVVIQPDKAGAKDYAIPINVDLTPSPPKIVKVGVGFTTDYGPGFSVRYEDLDVFESAQRLVSELNLSQRLQGLALRYIFPGSTDFRSFTSAQVAAQREETVSYTTRSISANIERTWGFGKDRLGSIYLQLQKEDSTAGNDTTNTFLLMPGIRFSERRYDSLIRATHGFSYKLEARGTTESLGSDVAFAQFLGYGDVLFPLPGRFSLKLRGQAAVTAINDDFMQVPITYRFFTGGDNSVRGYAYQSLGPQDAQGQVVGGKDLLVGSIELEKAIGDNWGAAVFYDAGNAFDNFESLHFAQGAGVGVRYYTPVGPVRLDIARQIGVPDPGYRFHFTVGMQF